MHEQIISPDASEQVNEAASHCTPIDATSPTNNPTTIPIIRTILTVTSSQATRKD